MPASLLDQRLERRIGRAPVAADLPCEGERDVLPHSRRLLLRGGERRLRITALDLDDRERMVKGRRSGLQLDGLVDRPLGLIEAVEVPRDTWRATLYQLARSGSVASACRVSSIA